MQILIAFFIISYPYSTTPAPHHHHHQSLELGYKLIVVSAIKQKGCNLHRAHIMGPSFNKQKSEQEEKQPLIDKKKDYSSTDKDSSWYKYFSTNTNSFPNKQVYSRYN